MLLVCHCKHHGDSEDVIFLDIIRLIAIKELQCYRFNTAHIK